VEFDMLITFQIFRFTIDRQFLHLYSHTADFYLKIFKDTKMQSLVHITGCLQETSKVRRKFLDEYFKVCLTK